MNTLTEVLLRLEFKVDSVAVTQQKQIDMVHSRQNEIESIQQMSSKKMEQVMNVMEQQAVELKEMRAQQKKMEENMQEMLTWRKARSSIPGSARSAGSPGTMTSPTTPAKPPQQQPPPQQPRAGLMGEDWHSDVKMQPPPPQRHQGRADDADAVPRPPQQH